MNISNNLNAQSTFECCISQLASLILTQQIGRSVCCKSIALLYFCWLPWYGGRGGTGLQDLCSMICGTKWRYIQDDLCSMNTLQSAVLHTWAREK